MAKDIIVGIWARRWTERQYAEKRRKKANCWSVPLVSLICWSSVKGKDHFSL